jgi:transposase
VAAAVLLLEEVEHAERAAESGVGVERRERKSLKSMARRTRSAPQLAWRARIILKCAERVDNKTVAHKLRVTPQMVGKWRARFVSERLEGLHDEPRPGAPRQVADAQVEEVIVRTLEHTSCGATHWSTRSMAAAAGMSRMTVHRIWRAFGLQPHRSTTFKLSPDPLLIDKVRDIVGLYIDPPEHAMVLCIDEKSQIQALDRTQPCCPCAQGRSSAARMTSGAMARPRCLPLWRSRPPTSSARPIAGIAPWSSASSSITCKRTSRLISISMSSWTTTHAQDRVDPELVCQAAPLSCALHPDLRLVVESGGALVCGAHNKQIRRGSHRSVRELQRAIAEFLDTHNQKPRPFMWTKTADDIFASIARFAHRTVETHGPSLIKRLC